MITQELLNIISQINENLKQTFKPTETENILARNVKLTEEVWELSSEVLKKFYARPEKVFDEENLTLEFADVIFTTLLLAKTLDIDINKALTKKLEKINQRWGI